MLEQDSDFILPAYRARSLSRRSAGTARTLVMKTQPDTKACPDIHTGARIGSQMAMRLMTKTTHHPSPRSSKNLGHHQRHDVLFFYSFKGFSDVFGLISGSYMQGS